MVILGVDAHKRTHTLVAIDDAGCKLGERTVAATADGHLHALQWAARWPQRRFAVEDCRHVSRRLEVDLLAAGEAVARVPTPSPAPGSHSRPGRGLRQRMARSPAPLSKIQRDSLPDGELFP